MSITPYFDETLGQNCFKIRIIKKGEGGARVDKSASGFKTLAEAQKAEKKLSTEALRELLTAEANQMKWKALINEWYEAASRSDIFVRELAKTTVEDYYKLLLKHTSDWFNLKIDEIDKAKVWIRLDEVDRSMSIKSRTKLRTAIDSIFKWCMVSGRAKVTAIPTEGFRSSRKVEEKMPEILTLDEIRLLLKKAYEHDHEWYPVWAVALYTGMRSGELYALRWASVDFDNRMIYVHENWTNKTGFGPTKGRYWRSVPISDSVLTFLKELKLKTEQTGFVLPRFTAWYDGMQAQVLRQFCEGYGIPSIKFHTLRSCFATQLIKDGVAPAIVMKMAGWKDLKTMQRYIRLSGIEVKGATNGLKLLPENEVMGRVVNLFEDQK